MQFPNYQNDEDLLLLTYTLLQTKETYQKSFALFRRKVLQNDFCFSATIIEAIKQLLTHCLRIIERKGKKPANHCSCPLESALSRYKRLKLSEFSFLLALRLLREIYFEANYLFMTLANLQLRDILLQIAMFKKQSSDDERGKYIFKQDNYSNIGDSRDLEVIGFSIHKITLEIIFVAGTIFSYMPYHERFIREGQQTVNSFLESPMFVNYTKLVEQKVKFPQKLHYFKQKQLNKLKLLYTTNKNQSIQSFYNNSLDILWNYTLNFTKSQQYKKNSIQYYLQIASEEKQNSREKTILNIMKKIAIESNDRYFWLHFRNYIGSKVKQTRSCLEGQQPTENNLKMVIIVNLFIMLFSYHISDPELLHFIQNEFIEELSKIFELMLKHYCKKMDQKQSHEFRQVKNKKGYKLLVNCAEYIEIIQYISFSFAIIRHLAVSIVRQFHQKQKISYTYPIITTFLDLLVQIQLNTASNSCSAMKQIYYQLAKRIDENHQRNFHKLKLIFVFYEKEQKGIHLPHLKTNAINSIKSILVRYQKYVKIKDLPEVTPLIEYITIDQESPAKQEIEQVISEIGCRKKVNQYRSSYKLHFTGVIKPASPKNIKNNVYYHSFSKSENVSPTYTKEPSFKQSLKMELTKPPKSLIESLSRKNRLKKPNGSYSQIKSHSSLSSFSIEQVEDKKDSTPSKNQCLPVPRPSVFKQIYIETLEMDNIDKKATPMERKLKKISHNNFVKEKDTEVYKQINNLTDNLETKIVRTQRIQQHSVDKLKKTKYFEAIRSSRQQQAQQTKKQSIVKQIKLDQNIKTLEIQQQRNTNQLTCFCFPPKFKRELLKSKVLVRKTKFIEVGMISNLHELIITGENRTTKSFKLIVKIYITTLIPLAKITVNIKTPNWLECSSKINNIKENVEEQFQLISNFTFYLKQEKEGFITKNYGQLPVLNIAHFDSEGKKEIMSELLPILLNKFAIEKSVSESEFDELLPMCKILSPVRVFSKIATTTQTIKDYFKETTTINLDFREKWLLFKDLAQGMKDSVSVTKLQYVQNRQEILLVFFEGTAQESKNKRVNQLFFEIFPIKTEEWDVCQYHNFKTCFRSILSAI